METMSRGGPLFKVSRTSPEGQPDTPQCQTGIRQGQPDTPDSDPPRMAVVLEHVDTETKEEKEKISQKRGEGVVQEV